MKLLTIVAIVSAFAVSQARYTSLERDPPEKVVENGAARIVQGHPAEKGQFPHQVSLRLYSIDGYVYTCGGSLISNSWVLTAAHCVKGIYYAKVKFGTNITEPELIVKTTKLYHHPEYNSTTVINDLGLIYLNRKVPTSSSIKPVRLLKRSSVGIDLSEGKIATASGFGRTQNGGPTSETLNYADLKVITNDECLAYYVTDIFNTTICAVGISPPTASTCNGDSGGALVIREEDGEMTQVGITSFVSNQGCSSGAPSGYTRPEFYLDWISKHVTDLEIRP